ncbi:YihY/virulence factor BrkB family protein [Cellulomonas fimi]|uniref:Ribonuclease BN n=1 Tax=Cellulomonas fimi (strain ATCC 484 / DSM 20113 / JCM 1341 / CCUG 24087 / LMG 16345 / NBRC 15513 / NCIMB 8980 / NCTC 7547 / NRS-133) TaxID=590998 RepID=F4H837_CELFA|nr:YihY/virulence factor BrkB family protein [Cellulomonas fimi]AEE46998.1 ribonuclease BN [Cellulomonas fimi ATCC 484]NNH07531.1 YihY/virulence factor BrkB family protein [Cellulomonas fimi]VEH34806.1 Inner membrane protein yhjD [Cellulomonas fimi]
MARGTGTVGPAAGSGAAQARAERTEAARTPAPRPSLVERGKALLAWWQQTRPARANARFGAAGGALLSGGIAYAALFSVFAGLTIGYTAFMAVLGDDAALRQQVLDAIDQTLPGLIDTGENDGLVDPATLVLSPALTVAGVVALVVLVLSAISATAALRTGVRAMFGRVSGDNAVLSKLREVGGFVGIALAVLLSAVLTTAATAAARWLTGLLGWTAGPGTVVAALVSFVVDAGMFLLVVWFLAGQRPAWRDLRGGALIAATGMGAVRLLGTSVVASSATRNPLLASFAVVVTLLVWVNLLARIVLLAAAWTADPPQEKPQDVESPVGAD